MIRGDHHLLGLEPEPARDGLEHVDGSSVHVGLARLAEPAVVDGDAEALEETLQHGRPAVHGRGLDDLGYEPSPSRPSARSHGSDRLLGIAEIRRAARYRPVARRTRTAGVTRSISTSAVPGRPWAMGIGE